MSNLESSSDYDVTPKQSQVMDFMRAEVFNIFRDLNVPQHIIESCDIDILIKKSLEQYAMMVVNPSAENRNAAEVGAKLSEEIIETIKVQTSENKIKNEFVMEHINQLNERMTLLEKQFLSFVSNYNESSSSVTNDEMMPAHIEFHMNGRRKLIQSPNDRLGKSIDRVVKEEAIAKRKPEQLPNTYIRETKHLALYQNQMDYNRMRNKYEKR